MPFKSEAQRRKFHAMANRGEMPESTVEEWEHATPKKVKKNLPYHVKKASALKLAQLAVASNAFDLKQYGREKLGMDSVMISSFFHELDKLEAEGKEKKANEITAVGRLGRAGKAVAQEAKAVTPALKPGITQAMPGLKARASGMHVAGSSGVHSNVVPAPHAPTAQAGGLTNTHVKPQAAGGGMSPNLRKSLAIGGAAGGGMMVGHMMPHHQQQAQPQQQRPA